MSDEENVDFESAENETINRKAHKRLLAGVNNLHTIQHIRKATRNETTIKRNEFNLIKSNKEHGESRDKVDVNDLMNVLDKTTKHLDIGKKLKKTAKKKKVLPRPLEKPSADKLQRIINYEKTKENLMRWDAIVAKQKTADHLVNR